MDSKATTQWITTQEMEAPGIAPGRSLEKQRPHDLTWENECMWKELDVTEDSCYALHKSCT